MDGQPNMHAHFRSVKRPEQLTVNGQRVQVDYKQGGITVRCKKTMKQ